MEISDLNPDKFLKNVTYQSDPNPESKIVIPDGQFFLICSNLLLNETIRQTRR